MHYLIYLIHSGYFNVYTLQQHFDSLDNLSIVWMGDINNVLFSLIEAINF